MTAELLIERLKRAKAAARRPDPDKMDDDDAMEMADEILAYAGGRIKDRIESLQNEIYELNQDVRALNKAWDRWDLDVLEDHHILSSDDKDFVAEVRAMFTW